MPTYFSLTCQHCDSEFKVLPRDRGRKFCSHACSCEAKRKLPKETHCLNCGTELNRGQYKFCSQSCTASFNNKGVRRHGKSLQEKARPCCVCGKTIYGGRYCSKKCMAIGQTKYTGLDKIKHIKDKNRIAQHKWRAKYSRKLDQTANAALVAYIIKNCPVGWEVDHIIPLSKGGKHHENNLQYLPELENKAKGNRHVYSAVNREYDVRNVVKEFWCTKTDSNDHNISYEETSLPL